MLNKYQSFIKLSKTSQCSIYTSFNRQTASSVLIKRVKTALTWKEILCHKHLLFINKIKVFPKIHEIFKHKCHFYFVFEKPYGNSLSIVNAVQKSPFPSFLQLMSDLLESIWQLSLKVNNLVIVPEWVYFHRNNLKLIHFQPFLQPEPGQQNHVATHLVKNQEINPEIPEQAETADFVPEQYKKNLIFNLGVMALRIATGKKEENVQTTEEYLAYVQKIREMCQVQIARATDDPRIASFVSKMLSVNKYEVPTLQQANNFFQARNRQQKKLPFGKSLTVQIQMQKINLTSIKKEHPTKKKRNCCIQEYKFTPKENEQVISKLGFKSENQLNKIRKSKLLLPYLSLQNKPNIHSVRIRNMSMINRHNPYANSGHRQMAFRQHIKSVDNYKNEENA